MKIDPRFESVIKQALSGKKLDKEACIYLLSFEPQSFESTYMMAQANRICRSRLSNSGVIYAQIGIDIAPCGANCEFCSFAVDYTKIEPKRMTMDEIAETVKSFAYAGDIFGIFLMTMENVDIDYLLEAVKTTQTVLAPQASIWVNVGDMNLQEAKALKSAGVKGAYHALRLREGDDSNLDPAERLKTFDAIEKAGLTLYTCCEPIGPEHTAEEIVDRVFLAYEYNIVQHSAMRRAMIPSLPIFKKGQISLLRLAQITAMISMTTIAYPQVMAVACHESNLLGLMSGSNIVSAEFGANPRDDVDGKYEKRGLTLNQCRRLLFEAGYTSITTPGFNQIPLNKEYLLEVGAY